MSKIIDDLRNIKTLLPLLKMLTVRQVIQHSDEAIHACGINPYCINEGRADGSEPAIEWRYDEWSHSLDRIIEMVSNRNDPIALKRALRAALAEHDYRKTMQVMLTEPSWVADARLALGEEQ